MKQLQLFYSVNGGAEKTITLFGGSKALPEVTASHTIYLEELGLKAGDFVSYYAKATDNNGVEGPQTATSDIYFVEIRPFRRDYKPAQRLRGGGAGGGADSSGPASRNRGRSFPTFISSATGEAKPTVRTHNNGFSHSPTHSPSCARSRRASEKTEQTDRRRRPAFPRKTIARRCRRPRRS